MKINITIYFIFIFFFSFSQEKNGFYNAKIYLSVDANFYRPMVYNYIAGDNDLSMLDKQLMQKKDQLNYGFKGSLGLILKRNVAFCLESGIEFSNFYLPRYVSISVPNTDPYSFYSYTVLNYNLFSQDVKSKTISFLPKFEFTNKHGLLPLGLSHQIGFGVNFTSVSNASFVSNLQSQAYYGYSNTSDSIASIYKDRLFDKSTAKVKTYTFLYALSMKTALTEKLFINYGFRYMLNFGKTYKSKNYSNGNAANNGYVLSASDIAYFMAKQRKFNFISFSIGLTYILK